MVFIYDYINNINIKLGHTFYVLSVDFSPSGDKIVSGGGDNDMKIWDGKTY